MNYDIELISEAYNKILTSEADFTLGPKEQGRDFAVMQAVKNIKGIISDFVHFWCNASVGDLPVGVNYLKRHFARKYIKDALEGRQLGPLHHGWRSQKNAEPSVINLLKILDVIPEEAKDALKNIIQSAGAMDKYVEQLNETDYDDVWDYEADLKIYHDYVMYNKGIIEDELYRIGILDEDEEDSDDAMWIQAYKEATGL